jgi:hypothetical protein
MTDRKRLKALSYRMHMAICCVDGALSRRDAEELDRLRAKLKLDFDWIDNKWIVPGCCL